MSHLARRIKKTTITHNGEITVIFKNGVKVVIWKGEYYNTQDGERFRLFIDGFKYSVTVNKELIDSEIDGFVTYDVMLNVLNIMSRRVV